MAKNKQQLQTSLRVKQSALTRARLDLRANLKRRDDLNALIDDVKAEIPDDIEQQISDVNSAITSCQETVDTLVSEISALNDALAALGGEDNPDDGGTGDDGDAKDAGKRGRKKAAAPESRSFRCRSGLFATRAQRDAFYAGSDMVDFLQRVRILAVSKRGVTGEELNIPTVAMDVLRDNLQQYSKLISRVMLKPVSGKARQPIIGKVPEGIWMEMAGALNELELRFTQVEADGYKVGGFVPIDNYLLQDSDINLGEEIMYQLGQSIGLALDKALVFGKGAKGKMPLGIVSRLAQTSQPDGWDSATRGEWTDLHSAHVLKLSLSTESGTAFFRPLLQACAKAKATYNTAGLTWIMNDMTAKDLKIRAMEFNANAALVAGLENQMPVIGGEIVTLDFIPDNMIVGGYLSEYLLAEREGSSFAVSEHVRFLEDQTAFRGTARYDGQPISGEAFVAMTYDNTNVTTELSFAADYANTTPNSLVITSAMGSSSGKTKLTVAGAVNAANTFKAFVGAPAAIGMGEIPGNGWTTIKSGTTQLDAATGSGVTVVELDKNGKVISIGYLASVTAA